MELFIIVNEPIVGRMHSDMETATTRFWDCSDGLTNLNVLTYGRTYWYLNMDRPK